MAASDHSIIETPRLTLKPLAAEDAAAVAPLIGNYDVARWLGRVPYPYTVADAEAFIAANAAKRGKVWFIHDATGVVGGISIDGELGYWLRREAWGRGYATEAGDAAVDAHFADPQAAELGSGHFLGNARSRHVLDKLGFVPRGERSVSSRPLAQKVRSQAMELTRDRWLARRRYRIETERLVIREIRDEDWRDLQRIGGDPDVARMLYTPRAPWPEAEVRQWVRASRYRGRPGFRPVVCLKDGRVIGALGLGRSEQDADLSVAYFLDRAAWGRGYAFEAMRAFLVDVVDRFALPEIAATCFADNPASARILERLGFVRTGENLGRSAARLEPAPQFLYRLSREAPRSRS